MATNICLNLLPEPLIISNVLTRSTYGYYALKGFDLFQSLVLFQNQLVVLLIRFFAL